MRMPSCLYARAGSRAPSSSSTSAAAERAARLDRRRADVDLRGVPVGDSVGRVGEPRLDERRESLGHFALGVEVDAAREERDLARRLDLVERVAVVEVDAAEAEVRETLPERERACEGRCLVGCGGELLAERGRGRRSGLFSWAARRSICACSPGRAAVSAGGGGAEGSRSAPAHPGPVPMRPRGRGPPRAAQKDARAVARQMAECFAGGWSWPGSWQGRFHSGLASPLSPPLAGHAGPASVVAAVSGVGDLEAERRTAARIRSPGGIDSNR